MSVTGSTWLEWQPQGLVGKAGQPQGLGAVHVYRYVYRHVDADMCVHMRVDLCIQHVHGT